MRHYIGVADRGPTTFRNVRRDDTGEPLLLFDEGEAQSIVLDYTDWLQPAETIASVVTTAESATATHAATDTTVTVTISDVTSYSWGLVKLTVTSSAGEVRREVLRVRRTNRYKDENVRRDYV